MRSEDERADLAVADVGIVEPYLVRCCDQRVEKRPVDGAGDIEALDRLAGLAGGDDAGAQRQMRRRDRIGAGEHDHRVLATELEIGGDEGTRGGLGHLAPGRDRSGEADIIDRFDQGLAGRGIAFDEAEHGGELGHLGYGFAQGGNEARGDFRRLDQSRASGGECGDRIDSREHDGEIPRRDRPEQRIGDQSRRIAHRGVRAGLVVARVFGDQLRGKVGPAADGDGQAVDLDLRDPPPPGIARQRIEQGFAVRHHGIGPAVQDGRARLGLERRPGRLRGAQPHRLGLHRGGIERRDLVIRLTGARVDDLHVLALQLSRISLPVANQAPGCSASQRTSASKASMRYGRPMMYGVRCIGSIRPPCASASCASQP